MTPRGASDWHAHEMVFGFAVMTAGVLWSAAFALYLLAFAPALCAPRLDGKPG